MLRIIRGRAGSGKTCFILDELKNKENSLYIVPEQFSFSAEKKVIEKLGYAGLGGTEILSFKRLCYRINSKKTDERSRIDSVSQIMILDYLTKKNADKLSLFGGSAKKNSIASLCQNLISIFKRYSLTPIDLKNAKEQVENPILKMKLSDSELIYREYNEFLGKNMLSTEDDLTILKENIEEGLFIYENVYIDQFTSFTPQEYAVIEAMCKKGVFVTISLCTGESEVFSITSDTLKRLLKIGDFSITEIEGAMKSSKEDIKYMEKVLSDKNSLPYEKKPENIKLFRAKDRFFEVEALCREITYLVCEKGYKYSSIAVILRDVGEYESLLERVFDRFNIPIFIDRKTPLSSHSSAYALLCAIEVLTSGFSLDSVVSYAKTGLSKISMEDADFFENFCLQTGVKPWDLKDEERFLKREKMYKPLYSKKSEEDSEKLKEIREKLINPLLELDKNLKDGGKGQDIAKAFYDFIFQSEMEEKIKNDVQILLDIGEVSLSQSEKRVYDLLIETLNSFSAAFYDVTLTKSEVLECFKSGLSEKEVGIIPDFENAVTVGSIDRVKGSDARAVFIIGANDGAFPKTAQSEGIFDDIDIEDIKKTGLNMPPTSRENAKNEELLMYNALCSAQEFLYVSYPVSNSDGSPLRESVMVSVLTDNFKKLKPINEETDLLPIDYVSGKDATLETMVRFLSKDSENHTFREVLSIYEEEDREKLIDFYKAKNIDTTDAKISEEICEELFKNGLYTSVSRLESYRRCPFSYFAKYVLGLKPREVFDFKESDVGSFLHDFTDALCKEIGLSKESWQSITQEEMKEKAEKLFESFTSRISSEALKNSSRLVYTLMRLKNCAVSSASLLLEHIQRGQFEPLGYEIEFSNNGDFKPLTVNVGGKKITLSGRIDRADRLKTEEGEFVRIVDYKSGNKKFDLGEVYFGLNLQLAVYLTTLCENEGYKPAAMLYFRFDSPSISLDIDSSEEEYQKEKHNALKMDGLVLNDEKILTAMDNDITKDLPIIPAAVTDKGVKGKNAITNEQFQNLFERTKKCVRELSKGIFSGNFDVFPTEGACEYCEFLSLCQFDAGMKKCRINKNPSFKDSELWDKMNKEKEK